MSDALRHMARGGKTFYFASLWLDKQARLDAATAYSFCRNVDDIADNLPSNHERNEKLLTILRCIQAGDAAHPITAGMVGLIKRFPEIQEPVELLVTSCLADTQGIRIATVGDLLRYCHGVAGTVGLLMYPILGGTELRGRQCAADLGIAMQCTNIARDIIPDLRDNRIYLPTEWLAGVRMQALLGGEGDATSEAIATSATRRLLTLADEHYSRGIRGLHYLNPRARFAIRVAAECYSAIGARVIQNGKLSRARAVVPLYQKIAIAVKAMRIAPQAVPTTLYQDAL